MSNVLIYDFNQLVISSYVVASKNTTEVTEDMIRHLILNVIISHRRKFPDFKNVVIAVDSRKLWRKDVYPFYKAARKKNRKDSPLDWDFIYSTVERLREDFNRYFPYKVVMVDGAEADDIIATVVKYHRDDVSQVKIISSDKDFKQLQVFSYVSQFDPRSNMNITEANPAQYLFEMFLRGDKGDGVPNFLSQDDSFVMGIRQKQLRQTKIDECLANGDPEDFCSTSQLKNFSRNKKMIDLVGDQLPEKIHDEILYKYKTAHVATKNDIINYIIKHRLKNIMTDIQYL